MNKELKLKLANVLADLSGEKYLKSIIAFYTAPTIDGKKPSYLMTLTSKGKNLMALWKEFGIRICKSFNLEYYYLKIEKEYIVVLFYRKKSLERYVNHQRNQKFMQHMGYNINDSLDYKLQLLKERFSELCPHEIGIFLGIPVEDVEGFIDNQGKNSIMCKYWKVYDNLRRSQVLFNVYDLARSRMAEVIVGVNGMLECV